QLAHRRVIADDEPIKLPLVAQHLRERESVRGSWHTVDCIERAHQRANTRINSGLEWREVDFTQRVLGKIGRVVVATSFRRAISYEMFHARKDFVGSAVIATLKSTHTRTRERCAEERILTRAFSDAAPTRIARDVDHRREGPTQADVICFLCGDRARAFGERRIPTARLSEWNREDRAITVNHIETKQHRYLQARLIQRNTLQLIRALRATNAQR